MELTIEEIVVKLIGSITPVGQTEVDRNRLDNLKQTCRLVDDLILEIKNVTTYKGQEWSVRKAAEYAEKYLASLVDDLK